MIDTITYGLTKDLPGGPIYRPAEPMAHEAHLPSSSADDLAPSTVGKAIGGVISLGLLLASGAYIYLAL